MAVSQSAVFGSFVSGANLTAKQYYGVKLSTTAAAILAATNQSLGYALDNDPDTDGTASLLLSGIGKCLSKGDGVAIAVGDTIGPDANGKWQKITTNGEYYHGIALEASAADGLIISFQATPGQMRGA